MQPTDPESRQKLRSEYDERKPDFERFVKRLADEISELLERDGVYLVVPIEKRVKKWDSILINIEQQRKKTRIHSIADVSDMVGIRLIPLFLNDTCRICDLLRRHFSIIDEEDTEKRLGDSQFGYKSIHFHIKFPNEWLKIPTLSDFKNQTAEVQVRTASQHIWAASSHLLQYKKQTDVPVKVRRSINRLAALLEVVDLELERIKNDKSEYQKAVNLESDDQALNVDILKRALDSILPKSRSILDDPIADLLIELRADGITTLGELKRLLDQNLAQVESRDRAMVKKFETEGLPKDGEIVLNQESGPTLTAYPAMIAEGVWKTKVGFVRWILEAKSQSRS